jgi:predicted transcriptional regulator
MRRSKFETYVKILRVLAHKRPLRPTHIMQQANVNCSVLKKYLNFLTKEGLVEETPIGGIRVVYSITQRGVTALKYVRELNQVLPIPEEDISNIPYLY